jgi:hypothetical protein
MLFNFFGKIKKKKKVFAKKFNYNNYLIIILVYLSIFLIFNIVVLVEIKKDISNNLKIIEQEIYHREKIIGVKDVLEYKKDSSEGKIDNKDMAEYKEDSPEEKISNNIIANSFGDSFSGSTYIDMKLTNMYLDNLVTGLTFTPLYNLTKITIK